MAATDQLHNLFLKIKSEIILILQSHYPPFENVQVILLKFKMPPQVAFLNICDRKTLT